MIKLPSVILFDADGTLYDSDSLHFEAYKIISKKLYDFNFTWDIFLNEIVKGSKKPPQVLSEHGVNINADEFYDHKKRLYMDIAQKHLKPMPKLKEFLSWCKKQHIRCIVVSASTLPSLNSSLGALQIEHYFEKIVSHEDIGNKKKPHPYPYKIALEYAQTMPEQAIAIEDTARGIESAQQAGLRCVAIKNSINTTVDLKHADHIINNYREFSDYLLNQATL